MTGIYIISIGFKCYIGQSVNIQNRIADHKKSLKAGRHKNPHLQNLYNKYKEFSYKVLWVGRKEFLTVIEQCYINIYPNSINIRTASTQILSEEHKRNISKANKISPLVKESLKKAQEASRSKPKTEKQLEHSRRTAWKMSTPEANRKKSLSRLTSEKFKEACKRAGLARVGISQAHCKRYRGKEASWADRTVYSFMHTLTGEIFVGDRHDLAAHIDCKTGPLSNLIGRRVFTYHKWILLSSPLDPVMGYGKWSELLGSLEKGNQQPSLSSNTFEGSTHSEYYPSAFKQRVMNHQECSTSLRDDDIC